MWLWSETKKDGFFIIQHFFNFKPDTVNKSHCKPTRRWAASFNGLHSLIASGFKTFWKKMEESILSTDEFIG